MFTAALVTLGVATGLLVLMVTLFVLEDRREQRLLAARARWRLDRWFYAGSGALVAATVTRARQGVAAVYQALVRRIVRFLLNVIERGQRMLLRVYRQHRTVPPRTDEKDDSYLGQVASHKRDSALSDDEVARIKSHS